MKQPSFESSDQKLQITQTRQPLPAPTREFLSTQTREHPFTSVNSCAFPLAQATKRADQLSDPPSKAPPAHACSSSPACLTSDICQFHQRKQSVSLPSSQLFPTHLNFLLSQSSMAALTPVQFPLDLHSASLDPLLLHPLLTCDSFSCSIAVRCVQSRRRPLPSLGPLVQALTGSLAHINQEPLAKDLCCSAKRKNIDATSAPAATNEWRIIHDHSCTHLPHFRLQRLFRGRPFQPSDFDPGPFLRSKSAAASSFSCALPPRPGSTTSPGDAAPMILRLPSFAAFESINWGPSPLRLGFSKGRQENEFVGS